MQKYTTMAISEDPSDQFAIPSNLEVALGINGTLSNTSQKVLSVTVFPQVYIEVANRLFGSDEVKRNKQKYIVT